MQRLYSVRSVLPAPQDLELQETLFHNANGYLGVRGALEEGAFPGTDTMRGTYINGFYDTVPMKQAERLTHVAELKETMINTADTQGLRVFVAGEAFALDAGTVLEHERTVDMDAGVTLRRVTWRAPGGQTVRLCFRRMTSFAIPELFVLDCEITALDFSGGIAVESTHLALVKNYANRHDPRLAGTKGCHLIPQGHAMEREVSYLTTRTRRSKLTLTTAVAHWLSVPAGEHRAVYHEASHSALFTCGFPIEQGQTVRLVKYCVFADSRRHPEPLPAAKAIMEKAYGRADTLYARQRKTLAAFWSHSGVTVYGNHSANTAMQLNLYQLLQSAGRDGLCSIAAKGLSGEGYEGHYFWDTEMYMLPFFTLTQPDMARRLLTYRYRTLPPARDNARRLGHKSGALYPWRTITGRECSGYFPAGTAQYHIDGDIAYAVVSYYIATDDRQYMIDEGAEILLETARLWLDLGHEADGRFQIHCVTGPDEYTCMVNNNYYTNVCARHNLFWAARAAELLAGWGAYDAWAARLAVTGEELAAFRHAAETMYLPYHEGLGINSQDDSFLSKPRWDLAATPRADFPLLLHYHPLHLYRYQVCKQADTVMAHVLFDSGASPQTRARSFAYYEEITTHDSSLSKCIFCIAACQLGFREKARQYFGDSLMIDLYNTYGNTKDGIHTANMGGSYLAVVYGFVGLKLEEDGVRINPFLPEGWTGVCLRFQYRGSRLRFTMRGARYQVALVSGPAVTVRTPLQEKTLLRAGDTVHSAV